MHVLYVDDDELLAQGVEMALREKGHVCEVAELGKEALKLSTRNSYDIVVLDIGLPDIDGCQVVRLMKVEGVETPVLLQSGLTDPALPAEMEALGVNDFLAKPFSIAELIERMEAVLTRSGIGAPELDIAAPASPDPNAGAPQAAVPAAPPQVAKAPGSEAPESAPPPNPQARARAAAQPESRPRTAPGAGPEAGPGLAADPAPRPGAEAGAPTEVHTGPAADAPSPPRPSAVAEARAALRAKPPEPTRLETVAKCGAGALSKAVTTARTALATTMEAKSHLLPDPGAVPGSNSGTAGAAKAFAEAVAKARAALRSKREARPEGTGGSRAAPGNEEADSGDARPRPRPAAGKAAPPLSRLGQKARAALDANPISKAVAKARDAFPAQPGSRPVDAEPSPTGFGVEDEAPPAPPRGPGPAAEPELEAQQEIEAAPAASEQLHGAAKAEAEPDDAPARPGEPQAGLQGEPAPEDLSALLPEPGPEAPDVIETAPLDPEPPQEAPLPDSDPGDAPEMPGGPEAELEAEPTPDDLSSLLPEPGPEALDAIEIDPLDAEPPQDEPWPETGPDDMPAMPGGPEAKLEAETGPEAPEVSDAAFLDREPPQDEPWPEAEPGDTHEMPDGPEGELEAEPEAEDLSAPFPEPGPENPDEVEAASLDAEMRQDAPWSQTEPGVAPEMPDDPGAGPETETAQDILSAVLSDPDLEAADEFADIPPDSEQPQDAPWPEASDDGGIGGEAPVGFGTERRRHERSSMIEAAVIVDGEKTHACIILNRSENGAALRLGHPERDLSETFVLRSLEGPERRCRQCWREDDKIGVEFS